jgi:3-(3-hydroxy-phenyl)propionate hydroxylase
VGASYDVAVVGFGPSGAVAAGLLGREGVRVLVCERSRTVYEKPRAIALDHEIMRVLQQLGVVERVEPWIAPFRPSEYYGVDGQLIKRIHTVEPPYPLGYIPTLVFTQPPVETALREHVSAMPSVEVLLGSEMVGLQQKDDQVTLDLRDEDGTSSNVNVQYVIGCDGAWSTTREMLGIQFEDLVFDEPWLVVDVLANEKGLRKLPESSIQYCEPQRPCTYVIGPKNHRRWEISLLPGEDPKETATEAGTWRLLSRWITPEDGKLWRQTSYRFHALVAREWRRGRVFIAGDAAHQQPPFIGQGMAQGVRDVANLTWKLKSVLDGRARDALLDTYQQERTLHVRRLTTRLKELGAVICERDIDKARHRDAVLLAEQGGEVRTITRQEIVPPLETGMLSSQPSAANGTLFPQPWILQSGKRVRMDELCGTGWRLVTNAAAMPAVTVPVETVQQLQLTVAYVATDDDSATSGTLREAEGVLGQWFRRHECVAAIVRPDHYVYGVAANINSLISQLSELNEELGLPGPDAQVKTIAWG